MHCFIKSFAKLIIYKQKLLSTENKTTLKISFFYCNGLFILLKCYTQGNNHEEAAVEIHKLATICIVNAIKRHIVTQILFKKKKINLINFCRVAKFNLEHRPSNNYIEILIEKQLPCKTYFKKLKWNKLSGVIAITMRLLYAFRQINLLMIVFKLK